MTIRYKLLLLVLLTFFGYRSGAQAPATPHIIRLKNETIYALPNVARWSDSMVAAGVHEPVQALICFAMLPGSEDRYMLEQSGVHLLEYVPDNCYVAIISDPARIGALPSMLIYGIVNMQPEWKAGSYLWRLAAAKKRSSIEVLVSFSGAARSEISEMVAALGGRLSESPMQGYGMYRVVVAAEKLRQLALWHKVKYISPVSEIVPLDLQSRPAVKGNIAVAPPSQGGYGLSGDSVTVGVGDNTSGVFHIDLKERITNFNPAPPTHHGAHVNGIVGAAAIVNPLAASMAPRVKLVDFFYDLILPATGAMYNDYHMTITNNSYEVVAADCDYAGTYDGYSQFIDTLSVQYPEVLHVFASGNDGWMTCAPFPKGYHTLGGGYQPAKNSVVVGSMTDFQVQADDESRGPTNDGRLKPEIVATGLGAFSTIDNDQYIWAAGTSMAAPQVAGGLALLTQRYKQLHGGAQPRADLLKSILLGGAMDLGNPGPDFAYGFGVMDMYRSLDMIDNNHYMQGSLSGGDSQVYTVNVPANTSHLKVMLCWTDVPASALSSKQLVNDLDLTVQEPGGPVHMPLVPDHTPANVQANATEQADHLNNSEEVVILNPPAGLYTFKVKGYAVPGGPQPFALSFDIMPKGLHLTFPVGGEQLANSGDPFDSTRVFWDAVTDGNKFTVKLSTNNGASWTTISDSIPPDIRRCDFIAAGISSGKCLVSLSRNGTSEIAISQRFTINTPPAVTPAADQCPGYFNIHWSPVPNATKYYLLKKVGLGMQVVDSVADTVYSFSGLPLDEKTYVAVQPVIDGLPGYRSIAAIRQANDGNCTSPVSNGDLMAERLVSRRSGRQGTGTAFTAGSLVTVRLRNLSSVPASSYTLAYQQNGGAWMSLSSPAVIPPNGVADVNLIGVPVAPVGIYNFRVAVHNTAIADPQPLNDTMSFTITSLPNTPLNLASPYVDGFEAMPAFSITHDSMGVSPDAHWDFHSNDSIGRMRSFVNSDITLTGSRSVSLDEKEPGTTASRNMFIGTFNLSGYDTTAELRMDFDYMLHGIPRVPDGNEVSVRAYDTLPWRQLFVYDLNGYPGTLNHVRSLSLTDAMRASGRNFSSGFQLSFGQNDTTIIAAQSYGTGLTMDNFRLYTVTNDVAIERVVAPVQADCGAAGLQPVILRVHNGVNHTMYNVQVFYSVDGGSVFAGLIDSIPAKASINYTFAQQVDPGVGVTHSLNAWLIAAGDSYPANDSIVNYHFRNNQIVTAYPYLEDFEAGAGGYYSDGFRNSWQYGTPASGRVSKAASGTKAWKTNLTGHYNNLEQSYLYSPCFDLSGMISPTLSFSAMIDIENCGGTLCDAGFIEISYDGEAWSKLGAAGQGTNWYDSTFNVWNTQGFTRWHVATIPLPQPGAGQVLHLRFAFSSDPGVSLEGMAVDDIHIYDRKYPILAANGAISHTEDVSGSAWSLQVESGGLLSAVQPGGQTINGLETVLYKHDTISNPGGTQYIFGRSYTMKAAASPTDSTAIRLYLTDAEVAQAYADTSCPSCNDFDDAYSLGITQYDNVDDRTSENGTLADDTAGRFSYYPYRQVRWVPYDNGYYAELKAKPFSEYWFNDGGPTHNFPAGADYLTFTAYRKGGVATMAWYSLIDTVVNEYTPQWSLDSFHFASLSPVVAHHYPQAAYAVDDPWNFTTHPVVYYRLEWTMATDDKLHHSPVRKVTGGDSAAALIAFDARMKDHSHVLLHWQSIPDAAVVTYTLERARGTGSYVTINTVPAVHQYAHQYNVPDMPGEDIPSGTLLHYRLTALLSDGSVIVVPEQVVEWVNMSAVDVYPNPTHDGTITLHWNADAGAGMHLLFSDVSGRTFYETVLTSAQWENTTTIQTFNMPRGMYFLRADIDGRRYFIKVVYQ